MRKEHALVPSARVHEGAVDVEPDAATASHRLVLALATPRAAGAATDGHEELRRQRDAIARRGARQDAAQNPSITAFDLLLKLSTPGTAGAFRRAAGRAKHGRRCPPRTGDSPS